MRKQPVRVLSGALLVALAAAALAAPGWVDVHTPRDEVIRAELADTPERRSRGLMFRTELAPDVGMLFVFDADGRWSFWMKNTRIPLDMVWLDTDGRVVHVEQAVPPCPDGTSCPVYSPPAAARYVLELGAGRALAFGIERGVALRIGERR